MEDEMIYEGEERERPWDMVEILGGQAALGLIAISLGGLWATGLLLAYACFIAPLIDDDLARMRRNIDRRERDIKRQEDDIRRLLDEMERDARDRLKSIENDRP